ncbi:optic atrophy 3 protein homolog [Apis laboriosa]|uniref:optic atrophy 3 protein homolog n=1 Tax=Apis laboriosa TaxID=183418 RepID=UPI001CC77B42|nr:optic atrophy 3 protein homolog [Apis laboriosa]XP_043792683.1 optic atrophy 3 protein homolog [Apis laboriosa]
MVVGVFPALKLGVLFVKQISKPLAKFLVNQAKNHPVFRTYFIIPPAQFYHWAEVKAKMYLMNLGKPTKVAKLNETMAIELGANLMGEVIIFSVAGACLILEYNRQVTKESKKEEARLQQIQTFTNDIKNLNQITSQQESEIEYLQEVIKQLAKHTKYELIIKSRTKESNKEMQQFNVDRNQNTNINPNNKKSSIIERAILYYENNVKTDNLS